MKTKMDKVKKYEFGESSGLIPLALNPSTGTYIGAFSVSLSLLKVGMLGCVVLDTATLCQTAYGK
jgi:hypothetical protein